MMQYIYPVLLLFFMLGCASRESHPIDIYTLKSTAVYTIQQSHPFQSKILQIRTPRSTREIRSRKMHYATTPYQREAYAYSRWSDTPNQLIASLLADALSQSKLFKAVITSASKATPDLILESRIYDFYQDFQDKTHAFAVIDIAFLLIRASDQKVLDSYRFHTKIPTRQPDAHAGVESFNTAMKKLSEGLLHWLETYRN